MKHFSFKVTSDSLVSKFRLEIQTESIRGGDDCPYYV